MPSRKAPFPSDKRASRHRTVPQHWLMLDARLGDNMLTAARALPPCSAIVVRPQAMTADQLRPEAMRRLRAIARARGHTLLRAGRYAPGYDGVHNAQVPARHGLQSMAVHTPRQAASARQRRVDAVLISPIFTTRSHPDAQGIGPSRLRQLATQSGTAAPIALGGMTAARYREIRRHGAQGWAAIDAWLPWPREGADATCHARSFAHQCSKI